eukprot:scaffold2053_cov112-Cylindrotheca_fusiformis.AAC.14
MELRVFKYQLPKQVVNSMNYSVVPLFLAVFRGHGTIGSVYTFVAQCLPERKKDIPGCEVFVCVHTSFLGILIGGCLVAPPPVDGFGCCERGPNRIKREWRVMWLNEDEASLYRNVGHNKSWYNGVDVFLHVFIFLTSLAFSLTRPQFDRIYFSTEAWHYRVYCYHVGRHAQAVCPD